MEILKIKPDLRGQCAWHPTAEVGPTSKLLRNLTEKTLKNITLIATLFVFCFVVRTACAQQIDVAFGVSTLKSGASTTTGGLLFPSLSGGTYPDFSADFLLRHDFGVEGGLAWRGSQSLYGGYEPFRPVFWDFNAIWAPKISKNFQAEVLGGIGGENLRFYNGAYNCSFVTGCTTYTSSNHFTGDFGGGLRAYVWKDVFIRPEARVYLIHNNVEFSSNYAVRYGVSLGYSFGRH